MNINCAQRLHVVVTAALVLVQFCGTCNAEELGRLFTTPEQRRQLEKLVQSAPPETSDAFPGKDGELTEKQFGNNISVRGIVFRKNGKSTVWTNNTHVRAYDTADQHLLIVMDADAVIDAEIEIPEDMVTVGSYPVKMSDTHLKE